jgi:hypothetical protein
VERSQLAGSSEELRIVVENRRAFVSRLPFLVVAILLGAAIVCATIVRLTEQLAINPWEPAIAMEAMRLNAGLPVYESGHATHMYGPLLTVALAGIFRGTGLNLLAARIVLSIFALGLAAFLATILCRGKSSWLLAFLLFLGINFRTNLVFLSAQPDCIAILCAVAGLYLWVTREKSAWRFASSLVLFVGAMLFKQTSAAFALIPVVHALLWRRKFFELATSLIPAMSILAALGAIYFLSPQMFFAVVTVPATIKVYPARALATTVYLLSTFPMFLIALLSILRTKIDNRERWIMSALVVLVPVSIWTISKSGGSYNSLLPAYLAMTALFVVRLEAISSWLRSLSNSRMFLAASPIAVVILLSFFIQFDRDTALLYAHHGDDKYDEAVAVSRRLGNGVISPQDPTIAWRANKYFGRSLFFELDAHAVHGNWPSELPKSMEQELARADYVVQVNSYVPTPVFERGLLNNHFHPMTVDTLRDSVYTLWTRKAD